MSSDSQRPGTRPDYDGVHFGPAEPRPGSVLGHYHQQQDLITAEFSGDSVRAGRLAGVVGADGVIDAAYCQIMADGEVVSGRCVSTPTVLPDGRIQLTERWHRIDGSSGVSQIVQLATAPSEVAVAGTSLSVEGARL
ncbi:MAG: hypothetical protein ACR2N4_03225 [Jatrophihabitans sp.]